MQDGNVQHIREALQVLEGQRSLLAAVQCRIAQEGYKFETRINYFTNLSVELLTMSQEAMRLVCDLINDCPPRETETVLKSWDFSEELQ